MQTGTNYLYRGASDSDSITPLLVELTALMSAFQTVLFPLRVASSRPDYPRSRFLALHAAAQTARESRQPRAFSAASACRSA